MRAICENCGQVQPPDWQPGDLCGHCGHVVRREKRCHWCVEQTPNGKFCRHCGAGQVPDEQYGAARWLKFLGTDQFAIPERLTAMDPEQVEHFTRLYQRQGIVVERHVGDLAFAEGFARQRGWARQLEATLLPLVPMPDADIQALALPPARGTTDPEKLLEIREQSPLSISQALSALARLRLWQTSDLDYDTLRLGEDLELVLPQLQSPDPALRLETALTLSHWRLSIAGPLFGERELREVLQQALTGPLALEAATQLALIAGRRQGTAQAVAAEALAAEDGELVFTAALAGWVPDPLLAALRVPRRRYAAALTLTRMNVAVDLGPLLPTFTPLETADILRLLAWQEQPRPDLRPYFTAVLAGQHPATPDTVRTVRELQMCDLQPGDAVRLLREYPDQSFIVELLKNPALTPVELVEVCRELVARDQFKLHELPEEPLMQLPASFVAENWRLAPPESLRTLQNMARQQLATGGRREVLALHTFLRAVLWEETAPAETRRQTAVLLNGWYQTYDSPPLGFTEAAARPYFDSLATYVDYFAYAVERLDILIELEADNNFLRPLQRAAEPEAPAEAAAQLADLAALPLPLIVRLRAALVRLAHHYENWGMVNKWAVQLLGQLQAHAPWRTAIRTDLTGLLQAPDETVVYLAREALA